jgi:hypothetical protein
MQTVWILCEWEAIQQNTAGILYFDLRRFQYRRKEKAGSGQRISFVLRQEISMLHDSRVKKALVIIFGACVLLSFIPILYCGLFDYATADDFIKSYQVHDALKSGENLIGILKAWFLTEHETWITTEGTWASNFVLAVQPSIFGEHVYALTVYLCFIYIAIGTGYLLNEVLIRQMNMNKWAYRLLFWTQFLIFIQFMPFPRGGIFWYPGMAHYVMPMCFSLLMAAWMLKWFRTEKKRYSVYMIITAVYIGGSHYQHILIVLLVLLAGWVWTLWDNKGHPGIKGNILWLPIVEVLVGLAICVVSPGNVNRGEGTFGFHPAVIALMPLLCIEKASIHVAEYFKESPLLIVYVLLAWLLGWKYIHKNEKIFGNVSGILMLVYLFLVYAATEAPGIYAADNPEGFSGGLYDTIFQSMLLFLTIAVPLASATLHGWLVKYSKIQKKDADNKRKTLANRYILSGAILILGVLFLKSSVKRSTAYTCIDFARNGGLDDFVTQMEERIELLDDEKLKNVYVPEMNDQQGPFLHLQLSEDPDNYTNYATAVYYHKNSVTAVPREEYYKKYAQKQGHAIPQKYRDLYSAEE